MAIQRAAAAAGMAYLDTTTHLALHPTYGQWFSLRALILVDRLLRSPGPYFPMECPLSDAKVEHLKTMFAHAVGGDDVSAVGAADNGATGDGAEGKPAVAGAKDTDADVSKQDAPGEPVEGGGGK